MDNYEWQCNKVAWWSARKKYFKVCQWHAACASGTGIRPLWSTKTMANWIILCADRYLQPLYKLMMEEFLRSKYIHGDVFRWWMSQIKRVPPRTGCGFITMNTAVHRGWSSSNTRGYVLGTIRWISLEINSGGYFTCDGYQACHSLPEGITVT